jgi:hypothetical protein
MSGLLAKPVEPETLYRIVLDSLTPAPAAGTRTRAAPDRENDE